MNSAPVGVVLVPDSRQRVWAARLLAALLVALGGFAVVGALVADLFLGEPGLGVPQALLGLAGGVALTQGVSLHLGAQQQPIFDAIRAWWAEHARTIPALAAVTTQLALVVLLLQHFAIENTAFYEKIAVLTFAGFVLHHSLPQRHRLPFFVALSFVAAWTTFGFVAAGWLIALGLSLILICHLPLGFGLRVALLIAAGLLLALFRGGSLSAPWSAAIWPILGSMFMFRLIIYMYDLKHATRPWRPADALAYFFMLPNLVFPLFPVVDFATFRRTYYNDDACVIYQRGIQWMVRGITHLLIYRLVYQHLALSPADVSTPPELVQYIAANFLLYLKVSGLFHLIIGMLHLFGFNLPETHRYFYLASSFTDLWRRINIYWKDFMMKVFYYPAFFRLRRLGERTAIIGATLVVFVLTWFFHAYQWFWILGDFLLSGPDLLFWTLLAVLLVANSLYELSRGRKRAVAGARSSTREHVSQALRVGATFATMCILWSLWTSASLAQWASLWSIFGDRSQNVLGTIAVTAVLFLIGAGMFAVMAGMKVVSEWWRSRGHVRWPGGLLPTAARTCALVAALLLISRPAITEPLPARMAATLAGLQSTELNQQDATLLQRGYYENLVGVSRFNGELWQVYMQRPPAVGSLWDSDLVLLTHDFFVGELRPHISTIFNGARLHTNQWGMRDQEYELKTPPSTYRIALLGASVAMGWGVDDEHVFEKVLEDRLNRSVGGATTYEILNFAVGGFTPFQLLRALETKALRFEPDAVFVIGHGSDRSEVIRHLASMAVKGVEVPYPELREFVQQVSIEPGETRTAAERRLQSFGSEILSFTYDRIARICRQSGITPVWIYLPTFESANPPDGVAALERFASDAGFVTLDLSDVFKGYAPDALQVAEWDWHPNQRAHRLIAEHLHRVLREVPALPLRGPVSPATAQRSAGNRVD